MPASLEEWLDEVALAYRDAYDTMPFAKLIGQTVTEKDLFHFSPVICLKFRGIEESETNIKRAREAALSSYVATEEVAGDLLDVPQMAFAFCYIASHLGLELLDEKESSRIVEYIENNLDRLMKMTEMK